VTYESAARKLRINNNENVAKIIDGQHRIAGLEGLKNINKQFQINVTIFIDMDIEDQAMVFATINLSQTKVNKSLVYDLYEFTSSRSPQKTSHNIARLLNSKEGSPFYGRIKILGSATKPFQTLTQAAFVEAMLIWHISGSIQRASEDRELLKRKRRPARATSKEANKLVFRNMFLDERDAEIVSVLWNYFAAVQIRWPVAWDGAEMSGNILPRTNGFRALMRLLPLVYQQIGTPNDVPSMEEFLEIFNRIRMKANDFSTLKYPPGTSGEAGLYRELQVFLGY